VETIAIPNPHTAGLSPDEYEVISQKVTYRLAQRPGSYVVLKYVRDVVKVKATQAIRRRASCFDYGQPCIIERTGCSL